jgi:hypothetical protein
MRKLIASVSAAALFGFAQGAAQAQDRACKFAEWGYGYYRIEQQGEPWTYELTASGANWKTIPYGYRSNLASASAPRMQAFMSDVVSMSSPM